jgi:ubiquinone/menaquinone biosynthesis C-methylase UbiE
MEWYENFYTKAFIELCGFATPEQTQREAAFVVKVLNITSETKLLDLCCGYGRHAYEIAKLSHCNIIGVDWSNEYLAMAKEHYSTPEITYRKGDMRDLPFDGEFDAVINLFTSFGFFDTDVKNEQVIQEVCQALKPGGLFLLDYENKFWFVHNDVQRKQRFWQKKDSDTYHLIENTYDVMNEREVYAVTILQRGTVVDQVGYSIRLYSLPELRAILNRQGFELVHVWGDYEGNSYSVDSKRLITLSRKVAL